MESFYIQHGGFDEEYTSAGKYLDRPRFKSDTCKEIRQRSRIKYAHKQAIDLKAKTMMEYF